jgi:pyridoxal phosphate enzyme (YggS family)
MRAVPLELRTRFDAVEREVVAACRAAGRARDSVVVVGVIKAQPSAAVDAYIAWCRERNAPAVVGVNYIQEYRDLRPTFVAQPDSVHFIGRLQRNKARDAVTLCDVVETVDSIALATELERCAAKRDVSIDILIQVNISNDERKGGFQAPAVAEAVAEVRRFSHLRLRGFMTLTRFYEEPGAALPEFRALAALRDSIDPSFDLSMGMSHDFRAAIEAGSRYVRIGTALFGTRGPVADKK